MRMLSAESVSQRILYGKFMLVCRYFSASRFRLASCPSMSFSF
jgi:hypothetical protein